MATNLQTKLFPGGSDAIANYPWIVPPGGFVPVDRNNFKTIDAGSPGVYALETIQLTTSFSGWIVKMNLQANDFSQGFFSILQGGSFIRDYTNIIQPYDNYDVLIQLLPNLPLVLQWTQSGGNAMALRWRLFGWYFQTP